MVRVLTIELVKDAFQDAMPARHDAFTEVIAVARREKDHRHDMKHWYPAEVLRLAKVEGTVRLDMAASSIQALIESGWTSRDGHTIESAFVQLFGQYRTMRNEPSRDLADAIEKAVMEVAGQWPPDQPGDKRAAELVGKFWEFWVEASKARMSALKCYSPKRMANPPAQAPAKLLQVEHHQVAEPSSVVNTKKIFLGYPFLLDHVRPAVERAAEGQAQIIVASDRLRGQPLLHKIESMMREADLSLFDLTLHNPNVAVELGIAHANGYKYAVLYCTDESLNPKPGRESSLFSDIRGWDALLYANAEELQRELRRFLPELLASRVPAVAAPLRVDDGREERDREFAVKPNMHLVLNGGETSSGESFLNGFLRNVGRGIARRPRLFLPGFGEVPIRDRLLKPMESADLRLRYDDQVFYTRWLSEVGVRVEFEDELGNLYEQHGIVQQGKNPDSSVLSYRVDLLDPAERVAPVPETTSSLAATVPGLTPPDDLLFAYACRTYLDSSNPLIRVDGMTAFAAEQGLDEREVATAISVFRKNYFIRQPAARRGLPPVSIYLERRPGFELYMRVHEPARYRRAMGDTVEAIVVGGASNLSDLAAAVSEKSLALLELIIDTLGAQGDLEAIRPLSGPTKWKAHDSIRRRL